MGAGFVTREKGNRVLMIQCPNAGCCASVVASFDADRAKCKSCGHEWAWGKSGLKWASRGVAK